MDRYNLKQLREDDNKRITIVGITNTVGVAQKFAQKLPNEIRTSWSGFCEAMKAEYAIESPFLWLDQYQVTTTPIYHNGDETISEPSGNKRPRESEPPAPKRKKRKTLADVFADAVEALKNDPVYGSETRPPGVVMMEELAAREAKESAGGYEAEEAARKIAEFAIQDSRASEGEAAQPEDEAFGKR
ncbi:uncharacterized protein LY89DRAFT_733040 [Mollisia scopiformis]|uniref:Uncharacterized protein n=1 Tax=Mollisia scopiformis TaxID=149040 RepID=A0A194XDV2_MOLSC|nr:uncharacterized protein LY89DRAFT_733040 [Mollisia scopiformis]KUJ18365.1 hypothetical protein LY89DRAFT_733040 [Mollisia scopiformis]